MLYIVIPVGIGAKVVISVLADRINMEHKSYLDLNETHKIILEYSNSPISKEKSDELLARLRDNYKKSGNYRVHVTLQNVWTVASSTIPEEYKPIADAFFRPWVVPHVEDKILTSEEAGVAFNRVKGDLIKAGKWVSKRIDDSVFPVNLDENWDENFDHFMESKKKK